MRAPAQMAAGAGLPQFDPAHFSSEVFWEIISFLLLLFLFQRYVLPRINAILDARSMRIQRALEEAAAKRRESEALLDEYRRRLDAVHIEAEEILLEARREAAEIHARAMEQLQADIQKKKKVARKEIAFAKHKAMEEIRRQSAELVVAATEKLIGREMDPATARKLVEEAVMDLSRKR